MAPASRTTGSPSRPTRIVIAGGGFAGVYTAIELDRTLAKNPAVEVTLINRDNFFLFTPMLHEVAASDLDLTHIVNPIRKLLKRVQVFNGDLAAIDVERKTIAVTHGIDDAHRHEIEYDHLVIALGSVTNFYGLPGLAERALTMKTLGDAIHLRNQVIQQLEEADFECFTARRQPLLTFVVAGGGFAGVETIAAINDFAREAAEFYPNLRAEDLQMVLVHSGDLILPELGPELGSYAQRKLAERQVEIRTGVRVQGVTAAGVALSDGSTIPARTIVWTAGTSPNPLLEQIPCPKDRGRLQVNEFMEVPGWPGVWALGDAALVPDPKGGYYPPTAQHALRQGKVLAANLRAAIMGGKKRPFAFATIGQLAAIGRRTGVAKVFGLRFSGFFAWFLWRTIYLAKLPRFEKKLRVALDWTLDLLFSKDLVQFTTSRAEMAAAPFEARPAQNSATSPSPSEMRFKKLNQETATTVSVI